MALPNFFIVGAAKSGTTSLYRYLSMHPQVYMSTNKEPRFFSLPEGQPPDFRGPGDIEISHRCSITDLAEYEALFDNADDAIAVGESSVTYLWSQDAAERIHKKVPHARIIIVLRNPVERAWSGYLHKMRENVEPCTSFAEALAEEVAGKRCDWAPLWHYRDMGFYHDQLTRYLDLFGPEQVKVFLFEDLKADPHSMVRSIFKFLGVDPGFEPNLKTRENVTGVPKSRVLQNLLNSRGSLKTVLRCLLPKRLAHGLATKVRNRNLGKPDRPTETFEELRKTYREDILQLQELIDRDLSSWLNKLPRQ